MVAMFSCFVLEDGINWFCHIVFFEKFDMKGNKYLLTELIPKRIFEGKQRDFNA